MLVTGANGFVGRALATGFADLGWSVMALDQAFDSGWEDGGVRRIASDLGKGVPDVVGDVDLVVHAAWVTTEPATLGVSGAAYASLNLQPLLAVLEFAGRTRPAAFVFLSSSGVFSPGDGAEGLLDTHAPTGTSPYAATKRAGEIVVPSALEQATTPYVVRLGHLFGPGETTRPSRRRVSLVARWLTAARDGEPVAVRWDDPRRDWTFTSDLAAALERIADGAPTGRPIHLGSPYVYRDGDLADLVASRFPGSTRESVPPTGPVKPPMVPSDLPALRDFTWTDAATGLQALLAGEVSP